jgi:hypothetical protein
MRRTPSTKQEKAMTDYRTHVTETLQAQRMEVSKKFAVADARWREATQQNYMEPMKVMQARRDRDALAAQIAQIDERLRREGLSNDHAWSPSGVFHGSNF